MRRCWPRWDARSDHHLHDLARAGARQWIQMFEGMTAEAKRQGEIAADADLEQLAFELDACLELANYHYVLFRSPEVLDRARKAVRVLSSARGPRRRTALRAL